MSGKKRHMSAEGRPYDDEVEVISKMGPEVMWKDFLARVEKNLLTVPLLDRYCACAENIVVNLSTGISYSGEIDLDLWKDRHAQMCAQRDFAVASVTPELVQKRARTLTVVDVVENSSNDQRGLKDDGVVDDGTHAPRIDMSGPRRLLLPTVLVNGMDCIMPKTMRDLLLGVYAKRYHSIHVIDCRFAYEFEGGHIRGALHVPDKESLYETLQKSPPATREDGARRCVVFTCEFSSHRGPMMLRELRSWDRHVHKNTYPELYYPEVYLLFGGYSKFFESHRKLCEPQAYQPMWSRDHMEQMKSGLATVTQGKQLQASGYNTLKSLRKSMNLG